MLSHVHALPLTPNISWYTYYTGKFYRYALCILNNTHHNSQTCGNYVHPVLQWHCFMLLCTLAIFWSLPATYLPWIYSTIHYIIVTWYLCVHWEGSNKHLDPPPPPPTNQISRNNPIGGQPSYSENSQIYQWQRGCWEIGLQSGPCAKHGTFFWLTFQLGEEAALIASRHIKGHALTASGLSLLSRRTVGWLLSDFG